MKKTLGTMISSLRKDKGIIPKLAEILEISVEDLMQGKTETKEQDTKEKKENISINKVDEIIDTALKGIGIAMGIAVTVLSVLGELETNAAFTMLGIGLAGISISLLKDKTSEK